MAARAVVSRHWQHISVSRSQWGQERLVIHLILTTLSGEEAQLTVELQEFDRLQEFESAVLLPAASRTQKRHYKSTRSTGRAEAPRLSQNVQHCDNLTSSFWSTTPTV